VSKKRCESELDQVEAKRNHWRDLARQRADEVADLRRQLERNALFSRAFGSSFQTISAEIDTLQRERDTWKEEVAALRTILGATLPDWVITREKIEPATVEVGISLILRYGNAPSEWKATRLSKVFQGTYEQALEAVLPAVVLAAAQVPEPDDLLPNDGAIPGLSSADIYDTLHDLAVPYWTNDKVGYDRRRLEAFNRFWPTIEAAEKKREMIPNRNAIHTHFNKAIDSAFEGMKRRKGRTQALLHGSG
jgi:hypothetical protein